MTMKKIEDLEKLYREAEEVDQEVFAEQRTNIMLVSGEHYSKKNSKFWNRIRDTKELNTEQKLRLTKNHIQKISKIYINNIVMYAPDVKVTPRNETELQDQKNAELNQSVWADAKNKHKLRKKINTWAKDFFDMGEVAVKIFFDPNAGEFVGWEQEVDEMGQPAFDETGEPVKGKPKFSGDFVFERVLGFNLLRAAEAKTMDESPYLIVRKMVNLEDMKRQFSEDDDRQKMLQDSMDETYMVFDGVQGGYKQSKNELLLKEYYYRPCMEYPRGYYYITTTHGILYEGELPFGIFPIVYTGFDEVQTTPRHRSLIKQLRPYQAEINRAGSKIAEHQITLGDDKLILQQGSKISQAGTAPGVRALTVAGGEPKILPGRDGSQYVPYVSGQIDEMYVVANVMEDSQEEQANLDPYTLLYRSVRNRKKFGLYSEKFGQFLVEVAETFLDLARYYYDESRLILAVGRSERVNIAEFKNSNKLCYSIEIEQSSEDIDTMLGKQLVMNQTLQYVGSNLDREDIGKILKNMPFANVDQSFNDMTLDYDNATNDILALDRGERPPIVPHDNHSYYLKKLTNRMRQSDFRYLSPQIQQTYQMYIQEHQKMLAELEQKAQAAKDGFIPSGGYLVACDFYTEKPGDPTKTQRVRLPSESISWLLDRLKSQGSDMQQLNSLSLANQAAIGSMMGQTQQPLGGVNNVGAGIRL